MFYNCPVCLDDVVRDAAELARADMPVTAALCIFCKFDVADVRVLPDHVARGCNAIKWAACAIAANNGAVRSQPTPRPTTTAADPAPAGDEVVLRVAAPNMAAVADALRRAVVSPGTRIVLHDANGEVTQEAVVVRDPNTGALTVRVNDVGMSSAEIMARVPQSHLAPRTQVIRPSRTGGKTETLRREAQATQERGLTFANGREIRGAGDPEELYRSLAAFDDDRPVNAPAALTGPRGTNGIGRGIVSATLRGGEQDNRKTRRRRQSGRGPRPNNTRGGRV